MQKSQEIISPPKIELTGLASDLYYNFKNWILHDHFIHLMMRSQTLNNQVHDMICLTILETAGLKNLYQTYLVFSAKFLRNFAVL